MVVAMIAVGALVASGSLGGNEPPTALASFPTITPIPTIPRPTRTPRPTQLPTPTALPNIAAKPTQTPIIIAAFYYSKGLEYKEEGQYQQAIDQFTTAIQLTPGYSEAYWGRGNAYYELGQFYVAVENYNQVIQLDPNNPAYYVARGDVCNRAQRLHIDRGHR